MPEINGESLAPRAGSGAAYILGRTTPDALQVSQQGLRNRAAAAYQAQVAKQKAQDEDLKRFSSLLGSVKDDTGLTYQPQHMAERGEVGKQFMDTALDKTLTPQEKQLRLDGIKTGYEQRGLMGKQVDDTLRLVSDKARADKEYNPVAVTKKLHDLQYNTAGDLLPVMDFPLRKMDDVLDDHKLFDTAKIYENFVKTGIAPKEIYQQAVGGRPGQFSRTYSDEARFYKKNQDGSLLRDPKTHKAQLNITDDLLETAMRNPKINRDLNGLMDEHKALTAAAETKMANYEPLNNEERQALSVNPTMKDLLGRRVSSFAYANHRETERYMTVPQPRAAAGAGAAYVADSNSNDFSGEGTYDAPTPTVTNKAYTLPGVTGMAPIANYTAPTSTTKTSFSTYGRPLAAPVFRNKSGQGMDISAEGFLPDNINVTNNKGGFEQRQYTGQPLTGVVKQSHRVFTDPKTNKIVTNLKSTQEGVDGVRSGELGIGLSVDFAQHGGKNYAADHADLTKENLALRDGSGQLKYHGSQELAAAAASKTLEGGMVRSNHLYTDKVAASLDGRTGGILQKYFKEAKAEERRLRSLGPNTLKPARPAFLPTKSATKPAVQSTTKPNNQKADLSGGMFK